MFTGLIERVGTFVRMEKSGQKIRIHIAHPPWDSAVQPGESVAVQGVCLTAAEIPNERLFVCDLLQETLTRTALGGVRRSAEVNLERALRAGDRIGGHFVTGHVDGTARVLSVRKRGADRVLSLGASPALCGELTIKGSVACNGVSLTIVRLAKTSFDVHLIPHTWNETSLRSLKTGDAVNIESDVLGKLVRRHLEQGSTASRITMATLRDAGIA